MAVKQMRRSELSSPTQIGGSLYHEEIILSEGTESDIYTIPISHILSITVNIDNGIIAFSNDSFEKLEAGTADFEDWNGLDIINIGVVAFKVKRTTGTVTAKIAVKTATF